MSTIFLDRDGVINENRANYVRSWSDFCFLPDSLEAIARLTACGHRLVVCTNQAGMAKGLLSVDTIEDIHLRMLADIQRAGGRLEKIYYCPHDKNDQCSCRKPQPGMIFRARDELHLDMHHALFIGDNMNDVRAGLAAGIHAILVLSGHGLEQLVSRYHEVPNSFRIARDLSDAVDLIIDQASRGTDVPQPFENACYTLLTRLECLSCTLTHDEQLALAREVLGLM